MSYKKKLIEVALPLEAINNASAREKSIRHGHPSTLHLWWARRPLAAARAVIFAQMVDDPSEHPDLFPTEKAQAKERKRLFDIIEELVQWENTNNEEVLQKAREAIWQSWRRTCAENADHSKADELFDRQELPGFHDPFAGGGSLPLEAQRLGLESYASDLNPVAVLINKALIEFPAHFRGMPPINPKSLNRKDLFEGTWQAAEGLAADVEYYGAWTRSEAWRRIGHLYPEVTIDERMTANRPDLTKYANRKLTAIAWLWVRTVRSTNPAFAHVEVPLATSFVLSSKKGKEAYVTPIIEGDTYRFEVSLGPSSQAVGGTKTARESFKCIFSGTPISYSYIDGEAAAGRMHARLMAVVAEGDGGRVWLPATDEMERVAQSAAPTWKPETPTWGTGGSNAIGRRYGFEVFGDYFTPRQLVCLTTLSGVVADARHQAISDAVKSGWSLELGTEYGNAISTYLAFLVSQVANHSASVCGWNSANVQMRSVFARQLIPMTWDFAECNPFSSSSGSYHNMLERQVKAFTALGAGVTGKAVMADASHQVISRSKIASTDPPYYDNIAYADLSDFFYAWLRPTLKDVFPDLFATVSTPKEGELVALPYRHVSKRDASEYFLVGMSKALEKLSVNSHPAFPVTIYYAFKQSDTETDGTVSTGWDTFLAALIRSGLSLSGTWPMRTEKQGRVVGYQNNALASSIILVCRRRSATAGTTTRRDFLQSLRTELPQALLHLQRSNIAPVDLAQAAIGPGMAVYTRYSRVLDAEGNPLTVREALALINEVLDQTLAEQEGDFDADSRWALAWFEQAGFAEGDFGVAETLSKAKNTSIKGLEDSGILVAKAGKVRLLRPEELSESWDPASDSRLSVWEMVHHLVRVLEGSGEAASAHLVQKLGTQAEVARELCYRLYTICERRKRASEARSYNNLVQSWPEITRLARESQANPQQGDLFEEVGAEQVG